MNLPLRRRQQHLVNYENNEELVVTRKRISSRMMYTYCKYSAIAILFSGFLYSLFAMGAHLGETISYNLGNYYIIVHHDWLQKNVRIGKFLGEGVVTVAFEVDIDDRDNLPILWKENNNKKNNGYVIKFTGDHDRKGNHNPNFYLNAFNAYQVTTKLVPHPSIPQTIYFDQNTVNPFFTNDKGELYFSLANKQLVVKEESWPHGMKERLLKWQNVSISIVEKAVETHAHYGTEEPFALELPNPHLIKCFWKQLFDILDYVHSRNIRWVDTKLWNALLQDGIIVLFDWHVANTVVVDDFDSNNNTSSGITTKEDKRDLLFGHISLQDPKEKVSDTDVYKISKRIKEYLESQNFDHNNDSGDDEDDDLHQLYHLSEMMRKDYPPTMGWFLKHHKYFQDHNCCDVTAVKATAHNTSRPSTCCKLIW